MAGIVVNKRAPQMWSLIKNRVDFNGKSVLDLGCGYGDFMIFSLMHKAEFVTGVDKDILVANDAAIRLTERGYTMGRDFMISSDDIDDIIASDDAGYTGNDIIICFSCLPYLRDINATLRWMRDNSDIALIECQYSGDGPGLDYIHNDPEMRELLESVGWDQIVKFGETHAMIRDNFRTIWGCADDYER